MPTSASAFWRSERADVGIRAPMKKNRSPRFRRRWCLPEHHFRILLVIHFVPGHPLPFFEVLRLAMHRAVGAYFTCGLHFGHSLSAAGYQFLACEFALVEGHRAR